VSHPSDPQGSAGIGERLRLDPAALPHRYDLADAGADDGLRVVDLHDDHVVIRRVVAGGRMKLTIPTANFRGVMVRVPEADDIFNLRIEVVLAHIDPALSVPLFISDRADDIAAEWRLWAERFELPLVVQDIDGSFHEPYPAIAGPGSKPAIPRRRRQSALRHRRPSALMRRKPGRAQSDEFVHREREIIARH